jgi:hypothetical protein
MGRLAVVLVALLCFGMAGGTYYLTVHEPSQTMREAETVQGTVQSTDVESQTGDSGKTYVPVVTYEYRFEGDTYTNDRIELVGSVGFDSPHRAEEFLQSYRAGDTVTVYVPPGTPSNAFLKRGSVGGLVYGVIGFLGFLGLSSVFALVADLVGIEAVDIK